MTWIVIIIVILVLVISAFSSAITSISDSINRTIKETETKEKKRLAQNKKEAIDRFKKENTITYPSSPLAHQLTELDDNATTYIQYINNIINSINKPKAITFTFLCRNDLTSNDTDYRYLEDLHKKEMFNVFEEYNKLSCHYPENYKFHCAELAPPKKPNYNSFENEFPASKEITIKQGYSSEIRQALEREKREIENEYNNRLHHHNDTIERIKKHNELSEKNYNTAVAEYERGKMKIKKLNEKYTTLHEKSKSAYLNTCYSEKNKHKQIFKGYCASDKDHIELYFQKLTSNVDIKYLQKKCFRMPL